MSLTLPLLWANASWREAARDGVPEVDTDHLYLGLIALGGAAARLLGRHGVTLTSARDRVREARAADVRALGIDPTPLLLPPRPLRELGHPDLVLTPAARALLGARHPDTYACLIALLKTSDAARRLLAADGVLPGDLVAELREGSDDPLTTEPAPVPDVLPPPAYGLRVSRFVPVPPERLADLLASPESLGWWAFDPEAADVLPGGEQVRLARGPRTLTLRFHPTRRDTPHRRTVAWLQEALDGRYAGQPLRHDTFEIAPAPGGCELTHTRATRTFGVVGRLLAPVLRPLHRRGLLFGVATVAYAAAETPASR